MRITSVTAVLCIAFALSGCGGDAQDSNVIRSIGVNERYDYLVSGTYLDSGNVVTAWGAASLVVRPDGSALDKSGRIGLGLTEPGGYSSYIAAFHSYFAQDGSGSIFYRGDSVGTRSVRVSAPSGGVRRIKSPLAVGDTWQVSPEYLNAPAPGPFSAQLTGRQRVKVVAGSFECYVCEAVWNEHSDVLRLKYWYAPRIGLPVRVSLRLNDTEASMTLELINYPGKARYEPPLPPDDDGGGVLPSIPDPNATPSPSLTPTQQRASELVVRMLD